MDQVFDKIISSIEKGEQVSPFLFLSWNLELIHTEVENLAHRILKHFWVDQNSLFILPDQWESIKIQEMRNFLAYGNEKPRFGFQIFLIENISRMTLQSANSALKFFEEPGVWNIILVTNSWEAWILETILSRVQIVRKNWKVPQRYRSEYMNMVRDYFDGKTTDLVSFLFTQKLEKQDYREFLFAIFEELSIKGVWILDELEKDMQAMESNNVNGKYIIDKYLILNTHW